MAAYRATTLTQEETDFLFLAAALFGSVADLARVICTSTLAIPTAEAFIREYGEEADRPTHIPELPFLEAEEGEEEEPLEISSPSIEVVE